MFSELVKRNSRRSRRENGLFFASLLIAIIAFYIILSLSHQDVIVFLKTMESDAVNRLLTLVPALYVMTLCILFFLVYYANRFQLARRRHEFGVYLMLGMQRRTLFGMMLADALCRRGELKDRRFDILAVDDSFVLQFVPEPVRRTAGVDAVGIAARVRKLLH